MSCNRCTAVTAVANYIQHYRRGVLGFRTRQFLLESKENKTLFMLLLTATAGAVYNTNDCYTAVWYILLLLYTAVSMQGRKERWSDDDDVTY